MCSSYRLLFVSFLTVLLGFACKDANIATQGNTETTTVFNNKLEKTVVKAAVSKPAPSGTAMTEKNVASFPFDIDLKDVDGNIHKSSKIFKKNGKPTVLMFWLTTCGPCHMKLNAIKPIYPDWVKEADFNIYAISGDYEKNYPKFVTQTNSKGWEWETYNDVNRSFREVLPGGLNGYPQTFIFDKDGKLVYQDKRYRLGDEKKLFAKIKEISNS